ncbi:hypothetical protein K458DRAFT_436626 [Lentithecium fluviatile CBS 122367]|uniref:Extracellular membrane protein CFEM domain-containing protein n=1 Tax=Lentithecium fluviatile CBS 122367 TaxID=1168545 RepID=A0A6G1IHE1_9PLEO|nr:hypothetical protein K458DRAFT_436626 [Lentithecium fluviatile CBS 122367]
MYSTLLVGALLSLCTTTLAQVTDPATLGASIKYEKNYSLLPPCVNQCVWDIGDDDTDKIGGDVAIHLSCSAPYPNGCYCRPQSASIAHAFISSCATYPCSTPAQTDIEAGTSVYQSYCSAAFGAAYTPEHVEQGAVPTSATTAGQSSGGKNYRLEGASGTGTSSETTSSPASSGDEKIAGLSKAAFIGVVVSASCSIIGSLFGIGFKVYKHKKQTKMQQQQHMAATGVSCTTKV